MTTPPTSATTSGCRGWVSSIRACAITAHCRPGQPTVSSLLCQAFGRLAGSDSLRVSTDGRLIFRDRHAARPRTTEVPAEPSQLVAPAGLFWTEEDRALEADIGSGAREREPAAST